MHTPLFINNEYCLSFGELKMILRKAIYERGELYKEFLILIQDKVLETWLNEGTEEEKELAEKLRNFQNPRHAFNKLCLEMDLSTVL